MVAYRRPPRNDALVPWTADHSRRLGERVHRLRTDQGLTQERLAYLAGHSKNLVQKIERSRHTETELNLELKTLYSIADVLGVDGRDLLPY
ncbi:helix-turn-helix domain-containing protein [Nocardioides nitrophenolicus]|uniref:helix-turn-helix domain-containing protein n=1 Tax=Nocardioides nitrophenolicus TaxID=60489 RepID=UPI003558482D